MGSTKVFTSFHCVLLLISTFKHFPPDYFRFEQNGGKVEQQQITKLTDFSGRKYDAIFNCTGLGAQKLCNDFKMVPIRGQVIKVKAPWVKTAFYADYDTYILPGFDGNVTLGMI